MSASVKFVGSGPMQTYRVLLHGQDIGEVRHWERRYNLRRVLVSKGWRATTADGTRLYHEDNYTADTRREAAAALAKHSGHGETL